MATLPAPPDALRLSAQQGCEANYDTEVKLSPFSPTNSGPSRPQQSSPQLFSADAKSSRVLIVDDSSDSLDVLQTALERRGVNTLITRRPADGLDLARNFHPNVILLDLESIEDQGDATMWKNYDEAAKRENAPLILVARASGDPSTQGCPHVVSKPYHYAPLIRKIQELLEPAEQDRAA